MKRRTLLIGVAVASLSHLPARGQTIEPSQRALSASEVESLVAQFRQEQRERDARLAAQQRALQRTEDELRRTEDFYREQLEQLSRQTDPRRIAALADYSSGRREQALEQLFAIQQEQEATTAKERAAEWRQVAALALGSNTSRAIEAFEHALDIQPNDYQGWLVLTDLYIQSGQPDRALTAAHRAVDNAPTRALRFQALVSAARSELMSGRPEQGLALVEEARNLLLELLQDSRLQSEALRLSYYFAAQYGTFYAAVGDLEAAEAWFNNQVPFLRSQLATGLFSSDLQIAYPTLLLVSASNATRLGLKRQALDRVRELEGLLGRIDASRVRDGNVLALLSTAQLAISSTALRFESDEWARAAANRSIELARLAANTDLSNGYFQLTLSSALSIGSWAEMLVGDLGVARIRVDEAVVMASQLYNSRPDFFASLTFAVALLYQGVQRFLSGEATIATLLVTRGLEIVRPYESLSVQNATLGVTVWYLRAGLAALGLGGEWQRFEEDSRRLVSERRITQYELDYVQTVRALLFRRYNIAPPRMPD